MYPLIEGMTNPNAFVKVLLPSKREIFQRTGQIAVNANGVYTGDQPVKFGQEVGERMENFIHNAETAMSLVDTPQDTSNKDTAGKVVDNAGDNE